ncbi:MAG: PEP-CTERM sorting domain-containing protein [Phycisphaerales bacterium]
MDRVSFVRTPEPTSIALLTIGGMALLRRRRH